MKPEFEIGEEVFDDLTGKTAKILDIKMNETCIGYFIDSPYLGGGRHPWELSKVQK